MIAIDIACRIAQAKPVCYIAAEGAYTYDGRCTAWHHFHSRDWGKLHFYSAPVNFMDSSDVQHFTGTVSESRPKLTIVDTVARCMDGYDENSTRDMSLFVSSISRIQRTFDCGILLIHHTSKMGKSRGSTALAGALDSVMFLQRQDDGITIYNDYEHGGKNKGNKEMEPIHFKIIPFEVGEYNGDNATALAVRADKRVIDLNQIEDLTINQKALLEALEGYREGLSVKQLVDMTGIKQRTVYHNLKHLKKADCVSGINDRFTITETGANALLMS